MAPDASILAAAAASSKRPAASIDADQLPAADSSSSALPPPQGGDEEAARIIKIKSPQRQQLECPRCKSTNTKFCYYNNYSTAQPRHFCRACRRYWTHGGTLRDVPVGGATRRAKRRRVSAEPSSPPHTTTAELDACPPDLSPAAAFPFLSDGSYLPQFDLGFFAPAAAAAFSWPSAAVPADFYDGVAPAWDNGTVGVTGASTLGDIAGLDFTWPPPGN